MLRNTDGGGGVSDFPEKNITKVSCSMFIRVTRGWVGVQLPQK